MSLIIPPSRVFETLDYNPETGEFVWKARAIRRPEDKRWNTRYAGRPTMNVSGSKGYLMGKIDAQGVRAHRVAWVFITGLWPSPHEQIDHINGVVTDNRAANLRAVSPAGNALNQKAYKKKSGLPPGVNLNNGKFGARIQVCGQSIYLGSFETVEEAAHAYIAAVDRAGFSSRHGRE